MNDTAEKIERARKRREDELLLLLLLIADDGRNDTAVALRHGFPVQTVLQNTFARAVPVISGAMADAHIDAFRRFRTITGEETMPTAPNALPALYEQQARDAAQAMANTIYEHVLKVQQEQPELSPKVTARTAFDEAGYRRASASGLDIGTERAIVFASNVGMIAASTIAGIVTGLHHVSVLDDVTTPICRERGINGGLKLPIDDPYWWFNIPPLHHHCRSIILPIMGKFVQSEIYPTTAAMLGFGQMPAGFIEAIRQGRAA